MKKLYKISSEIVLYSVLFSYIFVVYSVNTFNNQCSSQNCACISHKETNQSCDHHQNTSDPTDNHFSSQTKHIPGMEHFCSCDDLTATHYTSVVYIQSQENKDSHKQNNAFENNLCVVYSAPEISAKSLFSKDIPQYHLSMQSIRTVVILL